MTVSTDSLWDRIMHRYFHRRPSVSLEAQLLERILERLDHMSAASNALTAAITDLTTAANNVATEVAALNSGDDQTAITNATAQIQTVTAQLVGLVPTLPVKG